MKKILTFLSALIGSTFTSTFATVFNQPVTINAIKDKTIEKIKDKTLIIFVFDGGIGSVKEAIKNKDDIIKLSKANINITSFSFAKEGTEIKDNFLNHQEYEVNLEIEKQDLKQKKLEKDTVKFKIKVVFLTYPQKVDQLASNLAKTNIPSASTSTKTDKTVKEDFVETKKIQPFERLKFTFDPSKIVKRDNSYVVLDFETANFARTSACQIAIALVKNGKVVEKYDSIIKPYPLKFIQRFVNIHHIDYNMVKDAKTFVEIWNDIKHFFNCELILAHNAGFDISVVKALVQHYQLQCPNFTYGCTWRFLGKTYLYDNYKLNYLALCNDITFNHHDASEDVDATIALVNLHFYDGYAFNDLARLGNYQFKKFYE